MLLWGLHCSLCQTVLHWVIVYSCDNLSAQYISTNICLDVCMFICAKTQDEILDVYFLYMYWFNELHILIFFINSIFCIQEIFILHKLVMRYIVPKCLFLKYYNFIFQFFIQYFKLLI